MPCQYVLSSRSGTECVAHAMQAMTDLDETATVLPLGRVGAFDSISQAAMLQALAALADASGPRPFCRVLAWGRPAATFGTMKRARPSQFLRAKAANEARRCCPPLMHSGRHRALEAIDARLHEDERLFVFLGDLCVVAEPGLVEIYRI